MTKTKKLGAVELNEGIWNAVAEQQCYEALEEDIDMWREITEQVIPVWSDHAKRK